MRSLEVELPGGAWKDRRLLRTARFRAVDGQIELAIAESAGREDIPGRVTDILACALAGIGGENADGETIDSLCVADRQYLMLHLGRLLAGDQVWLNGRCEDCGNVFDFSLRRSALVGRKAGEGFPFAALRLGGREALFRVPTGVDQAAVLEAEEDGCSFLFKRCLVSVDGCLPPPGFIASLSAEEKGRVEDILEAVSPAVTTGLLACCPECGHEQVVRFDPYALGNISQEQLFREVHTIASTYHWGEREIFALPRERRRHYLRLIDRSRGLYD